MPAFDDGRRRRFRRLAVAGGVAVLLTVAWWPTSRLVGVNYVVSRETLPLWRKAAEFIERDAQLRKTSQALLGGVSGNEAKVFTALAWTRTNISYAPGDRPVIDDHIWNVIERGYGQSDQQADVFTTVLSYAGVRAYWQAIGRSPRVLPLSYAWLDGEFRVFDVTHGIAFRTGAGSLATAADIARDHAIVVSAARQSGVIPIDDYLSYFNDYQARPAPAVSRAELQMPARRLWLELRRAFGASPATANSSRD